MFIQELFEFFIGELVYLWTKGLEIIISHSFCQTCFSFFFQYISDFSYKALLIIFCYYLIRFYKGKNRTKTDIELNIISLYGHQVKLLTELISLVVEEKIRIIYKRKLQFYFSTIVLFRPRDNKLIYSISISVLRRIFIIILILTFLQKE